MTAVAGLVYGGSRRPSAVDLERLLVPAVHPGSRPLGTWADGRAAVGASVLPFTAEDLDGEQPVLTEGARVVFAGRLDNRDELVATLGCERFVPDAELAAAAYTRWAQDCPSHLVGSFALVVWDVRQERLFCAVDHLATRTLFYTRRADVFAIGSTLRQVRPVGGDELDEGYLLATQCMPTGAPLQSERTPFVGIKRLLGGSALVVDRDLSVRTWRYWRPEELPELKASTADLGEQLLERLRLAVRAQSRSHGKVMCTLSGGLDSSTITGLVSGLARTSDLPAKGFEAVSLVFGRGSEADEREYRHYAERHNGIEAAEIDGGECWHFRDIGPDGIAPPADEPFVSYAAFGETRQFALAAQKTDCNVVLFGHGGDELMSGSEYFVADLLARGRFMSAWRRSRELSALSNRNHRSSFTRLALGPLLASTSRRRAGIRWDGRSDEWDSYWYRPPAPPWLVVDDRRRRLVEEVWEEVTTVGTRPIARAHELSWIRAASLAPALNDSVFYPMGLEMRSPFYDRRVVELALSIPSGQKLRVVDGVRMTKLILRAAGRDVLPREIHERRTKASLSVGSANGLRREWSWIWNEGHLEVAERGLVDGELVAKALRSARLGRWENIAHLTSLIVLERWLRGLSDQRRSGGR